MLSNSNLLNESMLSVISHRSSVRTDLNVTTEFAMNHLIPLNRKLNKLAAEENMDYQDSKETVQLISLEDKINAIDKLEQIRRSAPVRKIYPNSNVTLICVKDKIHYFAVPYEGYCFPMIVNFNMKILVNVLISFRHMRPNYLNNEMEFASFVFKIEKPPEPISTYEQKYVYMCITPLCDFKTNLSIKFNSRDFGPKDLKPVVTGPRDFSINYKEYMAFSENFNRNMRSVKNVFMKKDTSKIDFNVNLMKDFAQIKKSSRAKLAQIDSERCVLAKVKADWLESDRVNQITERKLHREQEIIKKRIVVENTLEAMMFKTFQRSYLIHHYLVEVMEAVKGRFDKAKIQKQSAMKKLGASARIVSFFCKYKKVEKQESTILTTVTGKKDKIFEINLNDAQITLQSLHLFAKINRFSIYEKALDKAGFLFKRCHGGALLNNMMSVMSGRIKRAQKNFTYTIGYKKACIQVYYKLFRAVIEEIDEIGSRYGNSKMRIKTVFTDSELKEIVAYLFEHYLYSYIKRRLRLPPGKEFETLEKSLYKKPWGIVAEECLSNKLRIKHTYSSCVNSLRLKNLRTEFASIDFTMLSVKSKARDEVIKKLKSIFVVNQEAYNKEKFAFDFDDIDAKLFLMNYFHFDESIQNQHIEDILFGTEYTDAEKQLEHAGSSVILN